MHNPDHKPPIAPVRAHTITSPHGKRSDPYYWLRDDERTDPEVLAYLKAENAYHAEHLAPVKPLEDKIYAEIVERLKQDDSTVPYRKNGYWYYIRFEPAKEHPIFARRKGSLDAPEQVMLDANQLAVGHDYYQIGEIDILALPLRRQIGCQRRAEAPGRNAIEFGRPQFAAERRQQPAGVAFRAG